MKKALLSIVILPFLYGCTSPPTLQQQQVTLDSKEINTKSGEIWTVNRLKEDYRKTTGESLPPPDALGCGWDGYCYYNAWHDNYSKGIAAYNSKKLEEEQLAESRCLADAQCKKSQDLQKARERLSWGYSMLLSINPYQQADADYLAREVCENVTSSQRAGVGRDVLVDKMRDFPGIAPRERGILKDIVKSCWDISSLSGDWRAAIRQ